MKTKLTYFVTLFTILIFFLVSFKNDSYKNVNPNGEKDSAVDRIVDIQDKIIWEIPKVNRFYDELDLVKKRNSFENTQLYVEVEGQGLPIVVIHGGSGATHHYFHPGFSVLAKDFKIIYYDQRGCGLSDFTVDENYLVDQAIRDINNLKKALGIKKWIICGHSFGGFLAQCIKQQTLLKRRNNYEMKNSYLNL